MAACASEGATPSAQLERDARAATAADAAARASDASSVGADSGEPEAASGVATSEAGVAAREAGSREPPVRDASARADARDAGEAPPTASCFGRCGAPELLAIAGACACDLGCLERADCCTDKHELCAVSASAAICPLTGLEIDPALCGSDLGWSFSHEGALEFLLGDSYDASCGVPLLYDDAQGRLPLVRPSIVPDRPPGEALACGRLLELDKLTSAGRESFAPIRLFEDGSALSSWLLETPLTGFSDGSHAFMLARRGSQLGSPLYLALRDPSAASALRPERSVYRVVQQFPTTHLQNPTATSVARFDPEQLADSDYREGAGGLFIWGRDAFGGASARKLYLAHQELPILDAEGASRWAPKYFAGLADGKPRWSGAESAAQPVIEGDFASVNQLEVAFIAALDKWIMLYGGDLADGLDSSPSDQPRHGAIHMRMADHPWGPWSAATPALFREHAAPFLHCDAPPAPPAGKPSGCDLDELPEDPAHSYSPGAWGPSFIEFAGCRIDSPAPRSPAFTPGSGVPCSGAQRGNLYAPNLLVPWTADHGPERGYAHAATLYLNVSTWAPYQVILAAITVHLP